VYIGHFAVAFALMLFFPGVLPLIILIGVAFPDLLWPILVFAGIERVTIDPDSPLQKGIEFVRYPYSHSLVLGTVIASMIGLVLALGFGALTGLLFAVASASHWILDTVMHRKDLPVLGFGQDRKVGLGLWTRPRLAFVIEYVFYAAVALLVFPRSTVPPVLVIGFAFHALNANSFFGFTKRNPTPTPAAYAALAPFGFLAFSLVFVLGVGHV
jgi:hypothetical protein